MSSPFRSQQPYTLLEAMQACISSVSASRRPNTLKAYRAHCKALDLGFPGAALGGLTPAKLEAWRFEQLGTVAPATVNARVAFLSMTFKLARKTAKTGSNPCTELTYLKTYNERESLVGREIQAQIEAYLREHWPAEVESPLLVQLAAETGMRRMEIFGLRRSDVTFYEWDRDGMCGQAEIAKPKGKKAKRIVALNQRAADILAELMSLHTGPHVVRQLYRTAAREQIANTWIRLRFKVAVTALGMPDLRLHDLRHTFASRCIMEAGADLTEVKDLLGHEHLSTTMRYIHLTQGHLHSVVQRLGRRAGLGRGA